MATLPLSGIRILLSGSIPESVDPAGRFGISEFVTNFTRAVLRDGGTIVHGSHPDFQKPLRLGVTPLVESRGRPVDLLTLVRSEKYSKTTVEAEEIAAQRQYAVVQIIPDARGDANETLLPMREWMAERCDVVVALGGKWYEKDKERAGVPLELEQMLRRGRPGFVVGAFGGSAAGYYHDHEGLKSRLQNGFSKERNDELFKCGDIDKLVADIIGQVKLLPLKRATVSTGRMFRILALDGGGIRGTFTAAVLAQWDEMLAGDAKGKLVDHFDLVAGTSTGAILALGLGLRKPPSEILDFYRKKGPVIFPPRGLLRHLHATKYDSEVLAEVLKGIFKDKTVGDSACRLVLPTIQAKHGEAVTIVTPHCLDRRGYQDVPAVDAALASAAAPTYFDTVEIQHAIATQTYLDGGMWANNPILPAIAEAIRHLNIPLDRIDVLSVGTIEFKPDFTKAWDKGIGGWALSTTELFFAAQETGAAILADTLLSRARHLRVNQFVPTKIELDDATLIKAMADDGLSVGMKSFESVRSRFLDGFFAPPWR